MNTLSALSNHFSLISQIRDIDGFTTKYADQTVIHPLALVALIVSGILLFLLPRKYAICSFLAFICFVSPAQRITLAGFDLHFTRLLILTGLMRILAFEEWKSVTLNKLDIAMAVYTIVKLIIYTFQQGTTAGVIFQLGASFDWFIGYVVFRAILSSPQDLRTLAIAAAVLALPVAAIFLVERVTGRNMFAVFGGVPEITSVREGKLRCQGPFPHPIIAGCFWAAVLPIIGLCSPESVFRKSWVIYAGIIGCLSIVVFCNSSTPLGGVVAATLGFSLFKWRGKMKWVVLATGVVFFCLHIVMQAPVWHLISRISFSQGSTSYFRFQLIDHAIRRFDEWALLGTKYTGHWFWGAQDITNQYILEGVRGGFATLVCFVVVLVFAFQLVGKCVALIGREGHDSLLAWGLGVTLFVHCVNFLGVSYFGQSALLLTLTLALISAMYDYYLHHDVEHHEDYMVYELEHDEHVHTAEIS